MSLIEEVRRMWKFPLLSTVYNTVKSLAEGRLALQADRRGIFGKLFEGSLLELIRKRGLVGAILAIIEKFMSGK